eukprot:321326-Pelagomonas_calceolata.AAC.2
MPHLPPKPRLLIRIHHILVRQVAPAAPAVAPPCPSGPAGRRSSSSGGAAAACCRGRPALRG